MIDNESPFIMSYASMDQVTYFEAKDKHGAFVKPELVHVVIRAADMDASDMSLLEEL